MEEHKSFSKKVTLTFSTFFIFFCGWCFSCSSDYYLNGTCLLFKTFCQASIRNGLWLARCDASDGISDGVLRTPNDNVFFYFFFTRFSHRKLWGAISLSDSLVTAGLLMQYE